MINADKVKRELKELGDTIARFIIQHGKDKKAANKVSSILGSALKSVTTKSKYDAKNMEIASSRRLMAVLMAPQESEAHMLIRYELLQGVLDAVGGLRITGGREGSSHTSVAVGGRWIH